MTGCCVPGCGNRFFIAGVKFHRIPSGPRPFQSYRRRLWLQAMKCTHWTEKKIRSSRICSVHFISGQPAYEMMESDPDWAPSLHLGPTDITPINRLARAGSARRRSRKQQRNNKLSAEVSVDQESLTLQTGEMSLDYQNPDFVPSIFVNLKKNRKPKVKKDRAPKKRNKDGTLTSIAHNRTAVCSAEQGSSNSLLSAGEDIEVAWAEYDNLKLQHSQLQDTYTNLQTEVDSLWAENERLKEELQCNLPRFSYSSVKWDDEQVLFLTGLHSVVFDWLVTQIVASAERVHPELTSHDHLLIVLMKLKLGLCDTDLAYRFRIQKSSVTNICQTWILALAVVLNPLIMWPSEDAILKNRPSIFRSKFKRCRCVIDCLEFIIARTSKAISSNQTNTIKYFIGVTPAGTVSFLSDGFSETVTDRQITKECGFLHLLEPLDELLANRPFLIRDELAPLGVTLHTPDFIKGKKIRKCDFEKQFCCVWTHVKRIIGWWKDYNILQKVIPVPYASLLNDVVTVCAALTNLNMSLVPKAKDHSLND